MNLAHPENMKMVSALLLRLCASAFLTFLLLDAAIFRAEAQRRREERHAESEIRNQIVEEHRRIEVGIPGELVELNFGAGLKSVTAFLRG